MGCHLRGRTESDISMEAYALEPERRATRVRKREDGTNPSMPSSGISHMRPPEVIFWMMASYMVVFSSAPLFFRKCSFRRSFAA